MADYFYTVELSKNEELSHTQNYVDKFLVELVCDKHRNENHDEKVREDAASEIAVSATKERYGLVGTENVDHHRATRFSDKIPTNIGEERYKSSCGCRAWYF